METRGLKPTVSVIIPNYNHALYLRERIDSVLSQDYRDFEIILLDDCSTDNSRDVIDSYRSCPQVSRVIYQKENSGNPFLQWECGIQAARGELIWIAESDDVADSQFLSTLVPLLLADDRRVLAFSHSRMIDSHSQPMDLSWHQNTNTGEVVVCDGEQFCKQRMLKQCVVYNASMVVFRKSTFAHVPHDYQQFRYQGDWLFWTYVCRQGQVVEVCQQLNSFRQHENKVSKRSEKSGEKWKDTAGILMRMIELMQLTPWQQRCLRGRWTKRFRKDDFPQKQNIREQFPNIYGGSLFDVICYEISK